MTLRPAREQDLEGWLRLRDALWPDEMEEHREELQAYFSGENTMLQECLLIEDSGQLVAFIELATRGYAEGSREAQVPYVEGWFVDERYREKGLGRLLLQGAETWAKQQGYSELASDALENNSRSIAVHKHLGFTETGRIVCFLKSLD